ncbi:MAG: alanyl-tRNA editing protein [Gemmatimonadota bacterium]|nr:alanyl-tRNA editing protein [Gemmatimonadota bacterium]
MTTRNYYHDAYTRQFTANVVEVSADNAPPFAILDASYFYPTSGGQPHDLGTIGGANVLDVSIRPSDGTIIHKLDAPIPLGPTTAIIDGARRFDHMQLHTGQHILSQAFLRIADVATIGFHLGAETVSIDLNDGTLAEARIAEAVALANRVVSESVAVRAWFPEEAEIESLALRKVPDVAGALRVVAIGDFDFSACGGTHVARSSEVGLLSILRVERMKRGTRIEFLAGHRARADYARKHGIVHTLSTALTCAQLELPGAVGRLSDSLTEARRALAVYRERDLDDEASRLSSDGQQCGTVTVLQAAFDSRPIDEVKGLALRLTALPDVVALLGTSGTRTQVVFARSENVAIDLRSAFDAALAALGGGKGGGGRVLMGSAGAVDSRRLADVLGECAKSLPN